MTRLSRKLFIVGASIFLLIMASAASSQELKWVNSNNESCYITCDRQEMKPVASGEYTNGKPYYVCAAEVGGTMQGYRPGYNLSPKWDNVCTVGYGGNERMIHRYKCLCVK